MKEKIKEFLNKYKCYPVIDILRYCKNLFHKIFVFLNKTVLLGCKKMRCFSQRRYLVNKYLNTHQVRKLQIGGGQNILDGWLNTDFMPYHKESILLDVTKPLFFKEATFDYVFCEHMIEHVPFGEGQRMLKECYRVLKPGGKIRISTPNLDVYLGLFIVNKSEIQKQHIDWVSNNWLERQGIYSRNETFVLNLMMHGWGHKFIYDFKTLEYALKETGFSDIFKVSVKQSNDDHFKNVEKHGDSIKNIKDIKKQSGSIIDNQMNEFGSLTVEAMKR